MGVSAIIFDQGSMIAPEGSQTGQDDAINYELQNANKYPNVEQRPLQCFQVDPMCLNL